VRAWARMELVSISTFTVPSRTALAAVFLILFIAGLTVAVLRQRRARMELVSISKFTVQSSAGM
ncbi:hypothetical protein ACC738_39175, partial [Rhizobium ruizarguesonis]